MELGLRYYMHINTRYEQIVLAHIVRPLIFKKIYCVMP
jgi:hypothetical protein